MDYCECGDGNIIEVDDDGNGYCIRCGKVISFKRRIDW